MNQSGIYRIFNIYTGDSYIGSTKNFRVRWNIHKSKLRNGIHHSKHLQNAWNKYGEDAFLFVMIEFCPEEQCIDRENYYLQSIPCIYNVAPFADGRRGFNHSEDTKQKIRNKKTKVPVYQFSFGGKLLQHFESIADAVRAINGKTTAHIISCCKHKKMFAHGYRWSYTPELQLTDKEHLIIFQYSKEGQLLKEWQGVAYIAKAFGVTVETVNWAINSNNKQKTNILNQFVWKRKNV